MKERLNINIRFDIDENKKQGWIPGNLSRGRVGRGSDVGGQSSASAGVVTKALN